MAVDLSPTSSPHGLQRVPARSFTEVEEEESEEEEAYKLADFYARKDTICSIIIL